MSNASEIRLGGKLEKQKNLERKTIKEWIRYIQEKIRNNSDYDSVYEEYKTFLENKLKENPKNMEVVCQLAAVYNELTYQWKDIYKLLNEFIKKYENELTDEKKSRIYTKYEKILKTDYKPEVKIYPKFLYDCFLIDCPRHQKLDK